MSGIHAYPRHFQSSESGMLLRDYFAAKAMQSILVQASIKPDEIADDQANNWSRMAYVMADAMMEERHRRNDP